MRYLEILFEQQDFRDKVKNSILDMITPMKSQGISTLTLHQLMDQLKTDPDIMGMDITSDFLIDILEKIPGISVDENSPDKNISLTDSGQEQENKANKSKVDNMALNQAKKDL